MNKGQGGDENPYEIAARTDVSVFRSDKNMKKSDRDMFDEYLLKIHKGKHMMMSEDDMREIRRIDESLLGILRRANYDEIGEIDGLYDNHTNDEYEYDKKIIRSVEQKEYEKKLLEMKLGLREEQLKQLMDIMKSNGKIDTTLLKDINNIDSNTKGADHSKVNSEIDRLRRVNNQMSSEIGVKEGKIEAMMKDINEREKMIDRMKVEIEMSKRKNTDKNSDAEQLKVDIDRLKSEAKRIVGEKEKAISDMEYYKKTMESREKENRIEIDKIHSDYKVKLMTLQNREIVEGKQRDTEVDNARTELGILRQANQKLSNEIQSVGTSYSKTISGLEQDIILLKKEINKYKSDSIELEGAKKREQILKQQVDSLTDEISKLQQAGKPSSNSQIIDKLNRDLSDQKLVNENQLMAISQLKSDNDRYKLNIDQIKSSNNEIVDKLHKEIQDFNRKEQEYNTTISKLKQQTSTNSSNQKLSNTSNNDQVDRLNRQIQMERESNISLENRMKQLTDDNKQLLESNIQLKRKISDMESQSTKNVPMNKQQDEEIKKLKEHIDLEEKKKQTIIVGFNSKLSDKDEKIKDLNHKLEMQSSSPNYQKEYNELLKVKGDLESQIVQLKSDLSSNKLDKDISNATNSEKVDDQLVKLKEILKQKNESIKQKNDEILVYKNKVSEVEALVKEGGGSNSQTLEMKKKVDNQGQEIQLLHKTMRDQLEAIIQYREQIEKYENLLAKNKIPYKK